MKPRCEEIFSALFTRYPALEPARGDVLAAYDMICGAYRAGSKLLICGNGGSAADADHIVGELMKGFMLPRRLTDAAAKRFAGFGAEGTALAAGLQGALPAIALHMHGALNTAGANDADAAMVFAQQVYGYGRAGDLLVALSTSGNARNVCAALMTAHALGMRTLGITGAGGGAMAAHCDACIRLPYTETYAIQEATLPVYHALCAMVEEEFFGVEVL